MSNYTKTTWENNNTPAINATNLNKIEDGIYTAHTELTTHQSSSDHDSRYYTEAELSSTADGSSGADKIGATTVGSLIGNTVQTIMEKINDSIVGVTQGAVALGSVDTEYLADGAVTTDKLDSSLQDELFNPTNSTPATATAQVISLPGTALKSPFTEAELRGRTCVNKLSGLVPIESRYLNAGVTTETVNTAYKVFDTFIEIDVARKVLLRTDSTLLDDWQQIAYYDSSQTFISQADLYQITTPQSLTAPANAKYIKLGIRGANTNPYVEATFKILLEQNAEDVINPYFAGVKDTNYQRVKATGKNVLGSSELAEKIVREVSNSTYAYIDVVDGRNTLVMLGDNALLNKILARGIFEINTQYTFKCEAKRTSTQGGYFLITYTDGTTDGFGASSTNWTYETFTSDANKTIDTITLTYANATNTYFNYDTFQIEEGSTATDYVEFKQTTSYVLPTMKDISSSVYDKIDLLSGEFTKNCSDWYSLSGNAFSWSFITDGSGFKVISVPYSSFSNIGTLMSAGTKLLKYNNKTLGIATPNGTPSVSDTFYGWASTYEIGVSDTDTGWGESWVAGTSFTGLTWGGLIKAYMNGWKLTTANTNVASCVWTGIASGTVKNAGAADYTHVTTTIDTGFTPYRMIYKLSTPVLTEYLPATLISEASGSIVIESSIFDVGLYGTNIAIENTSYPISSLDYVNKIDLVTGVLTPISVASCTVAAGGLTFTISGAVASEYYEYGYTYANLSTIPSLYYSYSSNLKSQVNNVVDAVGRIDDKISVLNDAINAVYPFYYNKLINPAFDVWQRGTTLAQTTISNTYLADRWFTTLNQVTSGTLTTKQNTANKQTNDNYCVEIDATAVVTTSTINFTQIIETLNVVPLRSKTVTFSVWLKANTGTPSFILGVLDGTNTNAYPSTSQTVTYKTCALSTAWQQFTVTHAVQAGANSIAVRIYTPTAYAQKVYISQAQLNVGNVALPFQTRSYDEEMNSCLRFYCNLLCSGVAASTSIIGGQVIFPVRMIANPTITIKSTGLLATGKVRSSITGSDITLTTPAYFTTNLHGYGFLYDNGGTPFTKGDSYDYYMYAEYELG